MLLLVFIGSANAALYYEFSGTVQSSSGNWTTSVNNGTLVDIQMVYDDDWTFTTSASGLFFDFDGPYGFEMHGNWATETSGNDDLFDVLSR